MHASAHDGSTRLFFTIGHPVAQIRMPLIMPAVFAALGVNAAWLALDIAPGELRGALDGLRRVRNLGGLSVTIPHKPDALAAADRASDRARAAGGANLLRFEADGSLTADMVDGLGFVEGLRARGFEPAGKRVWLVGSGGAGAAVAAALCEAGAAALALTDLDRARAEACVARLAGLFPAVALSVSGKAPEGCDLAVNASPCGLGAGDPLPFDPAALTSGTLVADVIMKPPVTALLRAASALGHPVQPGRPMLDHQLAPALRFFGIDAGADRVLAAIPA
ncbi:shikimate dehydrogenase [Azospirillum agricola]|uniref:shikimate dehydrogenase family protein n=1 Tax=Azospirillum agricola TaxID=1720247 RepID=UPI001AE2801C|nr:shikimate dehydrogenase [Azospirillum agricola]MBP2228411.1 shikimate dehydrogenase [Azospirillum agricola]